MANKGFFKKRMSDLSFMTICSHVLLWVSALVFLFPLYWMFTGSFKTQSVAIKIPPDLFPLDPTLFNYISIGTQSMVPRWFLNSLIVASVGTLLVVTVSSLAGYALAKKKFFGSNVIFWIVLSTMMVPQYLLIVPLFIIMRDLHLIGYLPALFLPAVGAPFSVFLLKQFSQTLPNEIFDAGKIDGCTETGLFTRLALPMMRPGIGAIAIFSFTGLWNDFLWPLIIVSKRTSLTLPVGIATLKDEYTAQFGLQMAAGVSAALPMVIMFLIFQRFFVKGLTLGAIKG